MKTTRALLLVLFSAMFVLRVHASTASVTLTGTGGTTATFTLVGGTPNVMTMTGSFADFNAASFTTGGDTSTPGSTWSDPGFSGHDLGAQTFCWVRLLRFGTVIAGPTLLSVAAPPKYKVTFNIPANDTEGIIRYQFFQGDTLIGEAVTAPGDGPQIIQFTDLDTADKVTMREIQYVTEWVEDPLHPGRYFPSNTTQVGGIREVSTGVPTTGGSTSTTPAAPKPTPPAVVKTPETPPAPAPTPAPPAPTPVHGIPVASPTAKPAPNPTPTGTAGTTKADTEAQTNQISAALDNVNTEAAKNTNAIVDTVNKASDANTTGHNAVITAINSASTAANAAAKAQVDAQNKAQGSLDRINASLGAAVGNGVGLNTAITGGPDAVPVAYPGTFSGSLGAVNAAPVTALVGKLPPVPNVFPGSVGSSSHFAFSLKFPPLSQPFNVDVDMAPYATPIAFLRGIAKACLSILFFYVVVNTLKKAVA